MGFLGKKAIKSLHTEETLNLVAATHFRCNALTVADSSQPFSRTALTHSSKVPRSASCSLMAILNTSSSSNWVGARVFDVVALFAVVAVSGLGTACCACVEA